MAFPPQGGGGTTTELFLGWFQTQIDLEIEHLTALPGSYANVASTNTIWIWDNGVWTDSGQQLTSADMTSAINVGTGAKVFLQENGDELQFRTLVGGDGVDVIESSNTIVINADLSEIDVSSSHTHDQYQLQLGYVPENVANRGSVNGYAPLDSNTKIPLIYLPTQHSPVTIIGNGLTITENQVLSLRIGSTATDIAAGNHTHSGFATDDHNHDTDYLAIDGVSVNSLLLNGKSDTAFANASHIHTDYASTTHNHTGIYLPIEGKATDADKLDGLDSTAFSLTTHNHNTTYLGISDKASDSDRLDGLDSSAFATAEHQHANYQAALGYTPENIANKGVNNGYAPLDASGKVPVANLPTQHEPVTISGNGIGLTGQEITLRIGSGASEIAAGNHTHSDYATIDHEHDAEYLAIDGTAINSTRLNGKLDSDFASSIHVHNDYASTTHNHDTTYLGINAKAADADKLDGLTSSDFATATHNHTGIYLPVNGTAANSSLLEGLSASDFATDDHTHAGYQTALGYTPENIDNKGIANGYAPLNSEGKIPPGMMYSINLTDVSVGVAYPAVPNEGDVCIRTDLNKTYIFDGVQWVELLVPSGYIQVVNGKSGADITLVPLDLGIQLGTSAGSYAEGNHTHSGIYLPIAGKAVDSELLDGHDTSYFAVSTHNHDAAYLGINAKAIDSDKLDGLDSSAFSLTTHTHTGFQTELGFTPENAANKGVANGYVPLNSETKISDVYLPDYHDPVTISGNGLTLTAQELALSIGTGASQVAAGNHTHSGFAVSDHNHDSDYLAIDGVSVNSLLLNGKADSEFATVSHTHTGFADTVHNHDDLYLGITAKATDSDKLDGLDSSAFSLTGHNHTGVYLPIDGVATNSTLFNGLNPDYFATAEHTHSEYEPLLDYTPENVLNKGIANGYAPLDALGKVPLEVLPEIPDQHSPITITGAGLTLTDQELSLKIGNTASDVAAGNHSHTLDNLTDVIITNARENQILTINADGDVINKTPAFMSKSPVASRNTLTMFSDNGGNMIVNTGITFTNSGYDFSGGYIRNTIVDGGCFD
ncbi:MAG: hypothetical protein BWY47_00053 [Bacteroidetes bacterium ADurb.Bin302]|nr:MAG: hypothetical protein BWY47_00053 [Bacteroidetes bacterium ADurb.Bin302]